MTRLVIVGAGGHGKVVADAAHMMKKWDEIVFVDSKYPGQKYCSRWRVVGGDDCLDSFCEETEFVVAIGSNSIRNKIHKELVDRNFKVATIIHPDSRVSEFSNIGIGSVVFAQAVVNIDCEIGEACIVNTGAIIDHDCKIGRSVHVSPGASVAGEVSIGDGSWIGAGATIIQQINIGAYATIGAGAVVIKAVLDKVTVVGVPAKPLN